MGKGRDKRGGERRLGQGGAVEGQGGADRGTNTGADRYAPS